MSAEARRGGNTESAFRAPGHRTATLSRPEDAEAAIAAGDTAAARRMLENLRRRLDGCELMPIADTNDWIVDCTEQNEIRSLLDALLATL